MLCLATYVAVFSFLAGRGGSATLVSIQKILGGLVFLTCLAVCTTALAMHPLVTIQGRVCFETFSARWTLEHLADLVVSAIYPMLYLSAKTGAPCRNRTHDRRVRAACFTT